MVLTDTHAHLYLDQFDKDRKEVIERATEAGVKKICMPNIDADSIDSMLEVEQQYPDSCVAAMGLHPCSVDKHFEKALYTIEDWLSKRAFIALGEIGTDLYWDKTYWEQQQEALKIQVQWARQYKIPVIIHCRDSIDETIALLKTEASEELTGVFHCFAGTLDQAKAITEMGFYVGLGGVSTFKNSGMTEVIPELEVDKILIETDCPYLAPVPYRGKRNEPAYVAEVVKKIATCLQKPEIEIAKQTSLNSEKLFGWRVE